MAISDRTRDVLRDGIADKAAMEELVDTIDAFASGVVPPDSIDNNELAVDVKVGSLATLTTTDKSSVTAAINELDANKLDAVNPSVVGNFVSFADAIGGQADSGVSAADFPAAVSPSVVDNIVTFSDVTGGQQDSGVSINNLTEQTGMIPTATLAMGTNPAPGETVVIGADVYEFDGVGANINVAIGLNVGATIITFLNAINTLGTELVFADSVASGVRIQRADAVGGAPEVGISNVALDETLGAVADVWNQTNLSTTSRNPSTQFAQIKVVINATNAATPFQVIAPFVARSWDFSAFTTGGVLKATTAACVPTPTASTTEFDIDPTAGATPLVDTDYIIVTAVA